MNEAIVGSSFMKRRQ